MNSPSLVQPEREVTFEDPSPNPSLETALKVADWSCQADEDYPPPSSDSMEMLDLTKPMEGNDCASLARSSDETVDWSQSAGGDLGNPPVLDPHVSEFLLGTEASGSRGD